MTTFEIKAPDNRLLRMEHGSLATLKAQLLPGYEVAGIVYGAASDGTGGLVEKIGGPSLMSMLLESHGDELVTWLNSQPHASLQFDAGKIGEAVAAYMSSQPVQPQ